MPRRPDVWIGSATATSQADQSLSSPYRRALGVTPTEPDPTPRLDAEPGPSVAGSPPPTPPPARRARWQWAVLGVLLACAVLGLVAGIDVGLRGDSFFPSPAPPGAARPTIVVVARVEPSPSPISGSTAVSASASASASSTSIEATAGEYVVEDGDTMRGVAEKVYGDADLWPRIYSANRDLVGPNPDNLQVGMHLRIPPAN